MAFGILGPLELREDGVPIASGGPGERSVLGILLLSANDVVPTDRLVDELWGEDAPKTAVKTVQVYVSRLRKRLGGDVIVTRPPGYALMADDDQIDQRRFERLADHGRRALAGGNAPLARRVLAEALALWRGAPLSDFAYEAFAQAEAARLNELRLATLEDRIDADLQCGQAGELVAELYALTARHPLRERFRGQLMLSLYRSGREAEALDVYHDARRTLIDELGIEPSRQLEELQRAILAHDAALERPRAPRAPGLLVGRDAELRSALQALTDASERRGRVVLLSGEAGIGKSRLADEVAARARDERMHVLRGAAWEAGGAPAYWPWVQLLRAHLATAEPEQVRRLLGTRAPELAELLPDLRELVGDIPRPSVRDPEALRFRLFDAVASFLGAIADRERPLLVVLDDLHAADESSLLLLRFVANAIRERGVVILGAYRDTMPAREDALGRLLGDLLREPHVTRIPLDGFSAEDVRTYVELSTGRRASPELIETLHGRTAGNPLFVAETVRLLAVADELESGEIEAAVPTGVRDAVHRRLQGLPEAARGVLSAASVFGREFDPETLERVAGDAAVGAVDHAIAARLVTAAPGSPGTLRFSHALVRDVLYQAIPSPRRRQLHLQLARTLERRHAADLEPQLAQLAHHFCEAADSERARGYARRAAELAASRLAYEEAARLYRLALRLYEVGDDTGEAELCELLLGLGDVQARAGDDAAAKSTFLRAAEVARRCGMAEQLGRAALGYGGRWVWTKGRGDPHLLPLLEEAVSALPPDDSALRSRLLARLAAGPLVLQSDASRSRRFALTAEAVEIARRVGDPAVLAWALDARKVAIWAPDTLEEQWEIIDELAELAERVGDPEQIVDARICRLIKLVERGEYDRFDAELTAARQVAETLGQPGQRWLVAVHEPIYALLTGRLAGTERLIERAFELGRSSIPWNARISRLRQRVVLASLEGRPGDVEPELAAAAEEEVYYPSLRAGLASLYAELGNAAGCRASLRALSRDGFAAIPFDDVWLGTLGLLADACSFLGDTKSAATLYERLEPYAHRNLVMPLEASLGSAARALGKLAATLGDVGSAARWFERAADENERSGALPFAAHARLDHAHLLLTAGDHPAGEALLERAAATYRALGMKSWAARCEVATTAA